MKLPILNISKTETGKKELPQQFKEEVREDLIKKAVMAIEANRRQPYGANERAGKRHSAKLSRRRRNYRGSYGHGISRVPRKILSRNGTRFNWVGAVAPGTVGGRRAHPPKPTKDWSKKINQKERRKAIRSALSATIIKEIVQNRGHILPNQYPFVLENKVEEFNKTKQVFDLLSKFGFDNELSRAKEKKIRAGRGKTRNRPYKKKVGPLLVVSKDCALLQSVSNLAGFEVVKVDNLNAKLLAPGQRMGRLTIFSEAAIDRLEKDNLFM